ncbi:hypothetical protein Ga0100231_009780 [Opitutaceae bacterium TAV4]|nr:hypothetical protein Ga0100231_009780 [Opitutaceae bacterium TAV4]RRJ98654.1 hypothetical protein Ga0100230_009870 [Opitutaceae bacterium TAV3]
MMGYKPWIAGEATRALLAQPPRKRLLMEDALRWLAANPFVDPDFSVRLPDGRVCGVVCREKVILTGSSTFSVETR